MKDLTQEQWIAQISEDKNAVIIDARRPEEWAEGIQENAEMMNIMDIASFQLKASQLNPESNFYVYCRSGVRSVKACQELEKLGLENTYNLLGGMLAWKSKVVLPQ